MLKSTTSTTMTSDGLPGLEYWVGLCSMYSIAHTNNRCPRTSRGLTRMPGPNSSGSSNCIGWVMFVSYSRPGQPVSPAPCSLGRLGSYHGHQPQLFEGVALICCHL